MRLVPLVGSAGPWTLVGQSTPPNAMLMGVPSPRKTCLGQGEGTRSRRPRPGALRGVMAAAGGADARRNGPARLAGDSGCGGPRPGEPATPKSTPPASRGAIARKQHPLHSCHTSMCTPPPADHRRASPAPDLRLRRPASPSAMAAARRTPPGSWFTAIGRY